MIENEKDYEEALAKKQEYIGALSSLHLEIKDKVLMEICSNSLKSNIEEIEDELTGWEEKNIPNTRELNQSDVYDAIGRCAIISNMIKDFLLNAPAIMYNQTLKQKIAQTVQLINEVRSSMEEAL